MLIVGCKGLALQIFHDVETVCGTKNLVFYDDVSYPKPSSVFEYPVLHLLDDAIKFFEANNDFSFCLGLSNPANRRMLNSKFIAAGGKLSSVISQSGTQVSRYAFIGEGVNILPHCLLEPEIKIGKGVLLNAGCYIHHNVEVGEFCEIGPGVKILGRASIGNDTFIGANAVILPGIIIGNQCIIGAGAVVTKDVEDNETVVGIPARPLQKK